MSKLSKTAKASMGQTQANVKPALSDDELIRQLRIDRASKLWPGVQGIDALLRAYDAQVKETQRLGGLLDAAEVALGGSREA